MLNCVLIVFEMEELTEEWKTLYNEETHDLYFTPNTIPTI